MNTQTISLDVTKAPAIMPVLRLGQGDANGTTLVANIYDNGTELTLTGYDVRLCIQTPNGAGYYECDGTVSGNAATFAIDETYAGTVAGVSKIAYVEVIDGDTVVCSTNRFTVVVLKSAQEGADPSGAYNNGILQAIEDANDAAEAANSAAEDANDAADTAQGIIDQFDGEYYASPNLEGNEPSETTFIEKVTECDGTSAEIQSIKGNTVVWNQLAPTTYTTTTVTLDASVKTTINHKYLFACEATPPSSDSGTVRLFGRGTGSNVTFATLTYTTNTQAAQIFTMTIDGLTGGGHDAAGYVWAYYQSAVSPIDKMVLIDLTRMFGAGNEPATVAEFNSMFPEINYAYDAGSLLSVNMLGIETADADGNPLGSLAIPASDYFPNGMRSAGTVRDELTKNQAITRIASVDLGTKPWSAYGSGEGNTYRHNLSGRASGAYNIKSAKFANGSDGSHLADLTMAGGSNSSYIYIRDDSCADADAFKAAVNGVYLYYELATPTTQTIDPPLNLTYKVESGGTESIIKPSGTEPTSAAPTIVTFYAYNAEGLRDKALSVIAAIENGKASTNYAVGSYLIHKGTLYKVTSAIASGEEITPGTNVTATTVMAELIALTS